MYNLLHNDRNHSCVSNHFESGNGKNHDNRTSVSWRAGREGLNKVMRANPKNQRFLSVLNLLLVRKQINAIAQVKRRSVCGQRRAGRQQSVRQAGKQPARRAVRHAANKSVSSIYHDYVLNRLGCSSFGIGP